MNDTALWVIRCGGMLASHARVERICCGLVGLGGILEWSAPQDWCRLGSFCSCTLLPYKLRFRLLLHGRRNIERHVEVMIGWSGRWEAELGSRPR